MSEEEKEIKNESQSLEIKKEEINTSEKNEPQEEKTFMGSYFSGLKYGLVLGLAIVIGFSIVQNNKELKQENTAVKSSINASDTIDIATQSIEIKKEILEK